MKKDHAHDKNLCTEILTTCAVNNLRKLTRITTNQFNEKIKDTGLRHTQVCVMLVIGMNEGKALSGYAEHLGMDLSTLARSVETLEKSGLLMLESGKRRERLASLTEAGWDKIREVYPLWQQAQAEFLEAFGERPWNSYLEAASQTGT